MAIHDRWSLYFINQCFLVSASENKLYIPFLSNFHYLHYVATIMALPLFILNISCTLSSLFYIYYYCAKEYVTSLKKQHVSGPCSFGGEVTHV